MNKIEASVFNFFQYYMIIEFLHNNEYLYLKKDTLDYFLYLYNVSKLLNII